jgi:hypothetical protein
LKNKDAISLVDHAISALPTSSTAVIPPARSLLPAEGLPMSLSEAPMAPVATGSSADEIGTGSRARRVRRGREPSATDETAVDL